VSTSHSELFSAALEHHQSARLAEAEQIYRRILAADPDHVGSLNFLGVIEHQAGRHESAIDLIGKAIGINDRIPDCHNNMGEALRALGRLDEAVGHLNKAIALDPGFAEAHNNLGNALAAQRNLEPAIEAFRRALALAPRLPRAQSNLGHALRQSGRLDEAAAAFRAELAVAPDRAEAHNDLGVTLQMLGRLDEAAACLRQAIALKPDFSDGLHELGAVLLAQGNAAEAVAIAHRALKLKEGPKEKALFAHILVSMRGPPDVAGLEDDLARAISEPWARPAELSRVAANVLKRNPAMAEAIRRVMAAWPTRLSATDLATSDLAPILRSELLRALLVTAQVWDVALERLLTTMRLALLTQAAAAEPSTHAEPDALIFHCALARQCFINEYVFPRTSEEVQALSRLWEKLRGALQTGAPVPALWPAAVGAYGPLHAVPEADAVLERAWPEPVRELLQQQVRNPREEWNDRAAIARLTEIDDAVSLRVREQYEENPYPCWVRPAPASPIDIDQYVRTAFSGPSFRPLGKGADIDLLIAGCGSGQQAVETAKRLPQARILAVDLSLASLAYARRQARLFGVDNIEFGQADILRLGALGRTFDVIESTGVLHHLADPTAGLTILHSLLRPNGLLRLGLYSEIARANIVAVRGHIAERGYQSTADDIRRCRQDLLTFPEGTPQHYVTQSPDFFATSACRDLLFHVQEHRLTLPQIKSLLADLRLDFLGFEHDPFVFEHYRRRFPADHALTDLDCWHVFETENPRTFGIMYNFWAQKA
jgi:tetratricopeptide (TPR) repeat protein/2-polyprenyl-3-methyl-5-hydroxy-6-metoxy-1,4-benzoquinol methylase